MAAEEPLDVEVPPPAGSGPRREDAPARDGGEKRPLPRWKKVLLIVAGVLVVAGAVLYFAGAGEPPAPKTQGLPEGALGSNLVEGGTGTGSASAEGSDWSPALMTMGFSFFVGFGLGMLLRMFMTIAMLYVGLVFLTLLGLQHFDLVTVNFDNMESTFDTFVAGIKGEASSIKTFLTGSLPATGLGALGLFTGFRKS